MSDDMVRRDDVVTLLRFLASEAGVSIDHPENAPEFVLLHWLADRVEKHQALNGKEVLPIRLPYVQCATCETKMSAWRREVKG